MRVLFIGDGKHDVGVPDGPHPQHAPWPARGVVPALARKIVPTIAEDSLALSWTSLQRYSRAQGQGRRRNLRALEEGKLVVAAERAPDHGCAAVIAVDDRDGKKKRGEGLPRITRDPVPTVHGVAVESIEAWTLGACSALASQLRLTVDRLRAHYPGVHVESLYEGSGKPEHRPKDLLMRLAELAHQRDSLELREAVAEATDVAELERACPSGFAAFADALRRAFEA